MVGVMMVVVMAMIMERGSLFLLYDCLLFKA